MTDQSSLSASRCSSGCLPHGEVKQPRAALRIGGQSFEVTGRIVEDAAEDAMARRLLVEKYQPGYGRDLSQWGRTALPVALEPRLA